MWATEDEANLLYKIFRARSSLNPQVVSDCAFLPSQVIDRLREQARYEPHQALDFWSLPKEKSACVFLDNEGLCSVYQQRPASCRGFQVTSHPSFCSKELSTKPGSGMHLPNQSTLTRSFWEENIYGDWGHFFCRHWPRRNHLRYITAPVIERTRERFWT